MSIINELLSSATTAMSAIYNAGFPFWGVMAGASLALAVTFSETRAWKYFAGAGALSITIFASAYFGLPMLPDNEPHLPAAHAYYFISGLCAALIGAFLLYQPQTSRAGRTDIRDATSRLPKTFRAPYDPEKYFDAKKGVFFGLSENSKPIYLPPRDWKKSHVQLLGTTGSGKSVAAGMLLSQSVMNGDSTIIIDPKNDEFLPHVLAHAAATANRNFIYLDLTANKAAWNPFMHKSAAAIEELLAAGMGMQSTGSDADFYRANDRHVLRQFASYCSENPGAAPAQFSGFSAANQELIESARKLYLDLDELLSTPCVQAADGLDLAALIEHGAVIYVRGSTRNPRIVALQKIFLLACMQVIESRNRATAKHVTLFLDEFKYLLTRPAMEALGTIRDKCANVIVAHQSLADLNDCGDDLGPAAVRGGVVENCAIKLAYQARDPDTAEWLARASGTKEIPTETRTHNSKERHGQQRSIGKVAHPLIETNMLLSLPPRTAALYGIGHARYVSISPIRINKEDHKITAYGEPVEARANSNPARGLIDVD